MEFSHWLRRHWPDPLDVPTGYVCLPEGLSIMASIVFGPDYYDHPLAERIGLPGSYGTSFDVALRGLRRLLAVGALPITANVNGTMHDVPARFWNNPDPALVREALSLCSLPWPVAGKPQDATLYIRLDRLQAFADAIAARNAAKAPEPQQPGSRGPTLPPSAPDWKHELYRILAADPNRKLNVIQRDIYDRWQIAPTTVQEAVRTWARMGGQGRVIHTRRSAND
jgi:hypothetical protein